MPYPPIDRQSTFLCARLDPLYNIYHCFRCGPDGYLIEIQRFLDPAWAGAMGNSTDT